MDFVECELCGRKYRFTYLRKHLQRKHPARVEEERLKKSRIKCVTCQRKFIFREDLRKHINSEHTPLTEVLNVFKSVEEFKTWLIDEEKKSRVHYVRSRMANQTKDGSEKWYSLYCQYDWECNSIITSDSKRKRAQKNQGSYKLDGSCPAGLSVRELVDGRVKIKYCSTHVGHSTDLCHFRLPKDERLMLEKKLKANISFDDILDEIGDSVTKNLRKTDVINRKNLWYLASRLKNKENVSEMSVDDSSNVNLWLDEFKDSESNPFCFYKPRGEPYPNLKDDDFMLVIVTPIQLEILKECGDNIVCIDSTRGTNKYDFQLTSLLVVDHLQESFPVAFCFSNVIHTTAMKIFFHQIRAMGGNIKPKIFVSDNFDAYYDAWNMVMEGGNSMKKLLCVWYVEKCWRDDLKKVGGTKIAQRVKKASVFQRLQMLYEETDELSLLESIGKIVTDLSGDEDTKSFGEYFKKEWANRLELWAVCYYENYDANTSTNLKLLHCALKSAYIQGFTMNCLNTVIHSLFRLIREKYFDGILNALSMRAPDVLSKIKSAHAKSTEIEDKDVNIRDTGNEYEVIEKDLNYRVSKIVEVCPNSCDLICYECSICLHMYSCTCPEYSITCNICKHIHKVATKIKSDRIRKSVILSDKTREENENNVEALIQVLEVDIDSPLPAENSTFVEPLLNKVQYLHTLLLTCKLDFETQENIDAKLDSLIQLVLKDSNDSSQCHNAI